MIKTQGVSVIALIAIVAVVAVGGAAAYQYSQSNMMSEDDTMTETEQLADIKASVQAELPVLQRNLSAGATVDIAGALTTIARMKTLINNARTSASAELEAELDTLLDPLTQLEADITAGTATVDESLDDVVTVFEGETTMETEPVEADPMMSADEPDETVVSDESNDSAAGESDVMADTDLNIDATVDALDSVTVEGDASVETEAELVN